MLQRKTAVSLAGLVLGASALTGLATAPAQAASCREAVGPSQNLSINGYNIGQFYEGFDFCARATYAEFRFTDLWVSQQATSGGIAITRDDGLAQATNGAPNGVTFWDAGYLPVPTSGVESFTAAFNFSWWTGSRTATCQGFSNWDYHTGTPLGAGSDCS